MPSHWKWILLFTAAFLLFISSQGMRGYWQKKKILNHLNQRLSEINLENEKMRKEIDRLKKDPTAIEQIARRELGLIHPEEIEYRFVTDSPAELPSKK